jgi:3-oxoacyl-[acyl-carrier protein] reductase
MPALSNAYSYRPLDQARGLRLRPKSNADAPPQQDLEEIAVEDWEQVMGTNLRLALLLARRVAPGARKRGWGRIIFVSSVAAISGGVVGYHFTASKAARIGPMMHAQWPDRSCQTA